MATERVEVLIEGGKATAAPPLGPALGPLGVNIGQVVADINKKTQEFKGMQVPVIVEVNSISKQYTITIGTPPASQLILKEAGIQKGSSVPHTDYVADLKMEQIIKISKMKEDVLLGKDKIEQVKEILGTCQSMGVMVEGKSAHSALEDVNAGKYDDKIRLGKTELSEEERKKLEEEKIKLQEHIKEKHDEFIIKAKDILAKMQGSENTKIRKAMTEAGIPSEVINEVAPAEKTETK